MHPKALLDACADLVRLVLQFEHPADAVVSRYFREHRSIGPRERATLAETAFAVLRKKLLFEQLARSGSGPKERKLAILGFFGPQSVLCDHNIRLGLLQPALGLGQYSGAKDQWHKNP
jgi:16S rRNA (cytosine967-C5)-methyltransferase